MQDDPVTALPLDYDTDPSGEAPRVSPRAVVFDYYFTLARPQLTDFHALALELGCDAHPDDVERTRREHMAARPPMPPLVFDGEPPVLPNYVD